ncbi:hypothetical protein CDD83_1036 [Cordyceps sp. RAO-2017]|nr:hypothetical protein CDD83_1036 [Cordyceps sp. RAO-2017]
MEVVSSTRETAGAQRLAALAARVSGGGSWPDKPRGHMTAAAPPMPYHPSPADAASGFVFFLPQSLLTGQASRRNTPAPLYDRLRICKQQDRPKQGSPWCMAASHKHDAAEAKQPPPAPAQKSHVSAERLVCTQRSTAARHGTASVVEHRSPRAKQPLQRLSRPTLRYRFIVRSRVDDRLPETRRV